jgi:hypothetical protein
MKAYVHTNSLEETNISITVRTNDYDGVKTTRTGFGKAINVADPDVVTTAQKAEKVFQSGLPFRILNKPVMFTCEDGTKLWDMKIFWTCTYFDEEEVDNACTKDGFKNIDDCLDNMLKYIEEYNDKNAHKICGNNNN